ncbi:LysR family transcriptional regulator [Amycolatopsis jiangsuensis]|uniref:DNA-binding transcriptional LysR family regulator n=1 Tax=Amycolatopsis jiangsuensis TaxID=1181879 RepID=A0A840J487_9PSEU|nr:LysR family transcriptional regulator [Amycolatopsis jiangsuensis]MBB4688435.1 DNA-binding transcriptional LysR family regulator [Amycolatopsis jiangsuensis]
MERRQVEYFLAVVQHGGFTNAARALHVAQPSLSRAVRSLEREMGGSLFHRLPHGAVLTSAGSALLGPAQQVMRDLRVATSSVREVLGLGGGSLDIVSQTTLSVEPLAPLLGRFRIRHPQVRVRVLAPESYDDVVDQVRHGESEVGLVESVSDVRGLSAARLPDQEILAVLPAGRTKAGRLPRRVLAELDLVSTPPGTTTRRIVEDTLAGLDVEPRIVVETEHRAMIVPLVLSGAGSALLPRAMAEEAGRQGALVVPLTPAAALSGQILWRPGPLSPAAAAFLTLAEAELRT